MCHWGGGGGGGKNTIICLGVGGIKIQSYASIRLHSNIAQGVIRAALFTRIMQNADRRCGAIDHCTRFQQAMVRLLPITAIYNAASVADTLSVLPKWAGFLQVNTNNATLPSVKVSKSCSFHNYANRTWQGHRR